MSHALQAGPVRVINARNRKVVLGLMKAFHAVYVKNSRHADYADGEMHNINEDEAKRVGANYMLHAKTGELYALVPLFYYTQRPLLTFFEHSVPSKYKTMYFICNYSRSLENPRGLQANFLFCEAESYRAAFQKLASIFTAITGMAPARREGCTFIPLDAITGVFAIYNNIGVDVPAPIRHCEYAFWELAKTKIQDVILILEA